MYWDEANYANQAIDDCRAARTGGVIAATKSLIFADPVRPPAFRAAALPASVVYGPSLPLLRNVALSGTVFAFVLLIAALKPISGWKAGALATAAVFASPPILMSGGWFGTEYPLFVATGLLFVALLPRLRPTILASALALGLLSKASFALLAAPPILVAAFLSRKNPRELLRLGAAGLAGVCLSAGWWYWNLESAASFAHLGRTFARASMGDPLNLPTLLEKLEILVLSSLGPGIVLSLLILLAPGSRSSPFREVEVRALAIGGAVFVPLLGMAFLSPVFVPRHFCAGFLGLSVLLAVLIGRARPVAKLVVAGLLLAQGVALAATPRTFLPLVEQTDWTGFRRFASAECPVIAFMGGWPSLSPPEIQYAWNRVGRSSRVTWLWRFEDGPIQWSRVMGLAADSDVVAVVPPGARHRIDPRLEIDENLDNANNAEFLQRLEATGAFQRAGNFTVGEIEPVSIVVYRRTVGPE